MKSIFAGNVNSTTGNWTFYSCSRCCCSRCSCSCFCCSFCCCYPCWTCATSLVLFIYGQVLHSHWYRKRDHSLLHFAADFLHYDLNWPLFELQKGGPRQGKESGGDRGSAHCMSLCAFPANLPEVMVVFTIAIVVLLSLQVKWNCRSLIAKPHSYIFLILYVHMYISNLEKHFSLGPALVFLSLFIFNKIISIPIS